MKRKNQLVDISTPTNLQDPVSLNNDFLKSFSYLGKDDLSADQRDAYYNNILQLAMREQDWYRSSPAVQVERLMAAGMSRAAALQAVSSSGGSGSGAAFTPQMAGNVEQSTNERINAISNLVASAGQLSTQIGQLFQIGSQIGLNKSTMQLQAQQATYLQAQTQAMVLNNQMASDQYNAMGAAASSLQMLSNYENASGKQFDNLNDWLDYTSKSNDATLRGWHDINHSRYMQNPFYYAALRSGFDNYRKGDFEMQNFRKQMVAHTAISELGVDKIISEISNINSQTESINAGIELIKEQVLTQQQETRKTGYEANYQSGVNDAEFGVEGANGLSPYLSRALGRGYYEYFAGLMAKNDYKLDNDYMFPIRMQNALIELQSWQDMTPEQVEKRKQFFVLSRQNQEDYTRLLAMQMGNIVYMRQEYLHLTRLLDLYEAYSLPHDFINAGAKIGASVAAGSFTKGLVSPAGGNAVTVGGFR